MFDCMAIFIQSTIITIAFQIIFFPRTTNGSLPLILTICASYVLTSLFEVNALLPFSFNLAFASLLLHPSCKLMIVYHYYYY